MFQYRPFQTKGIDQVAAKAKAGVRRMVFQAPTGAGKTILFCGLVQRFIARNPDTMVVIAVHRYELAQQTIRALRRVAGIEGGLIIAGYSTPVREVNGFMVPHTKAQVIVGMVETLNNRFKKYANFMSTCALLIVDECHRGEFHKLYNHFPTALVVGFTATPISANKRLPLKNYFQDIVAPVTIRELIEQKHLAKNITITIKGSVNRKTLAVKGGEFDTEKMGAAFSTPKHVENCVDAYEDYCLGEKTIVFNCNVIHSKKVNQAFLDRGYNSRHMDATATPEEREEILAWFACTPDAILHNVALYTTGFDEPTVINCIVNRATMSLPLWLQMCGRASRIIEGVKEHFKILDLGDNFATHLDWDFPHNWPGYFFYPEKIGPKKGGGPTKICINPECEAMIPLPTKICPYCGADNSKPPEYDTGNLDLEVLTKGIDIEEIIRKNAAFKPYRALHMTKASLVRAFRQQYTHRTCGQNVRELLNTRYQGLVMQWCLAEGKKYDKWHKDTTRQWLMAELDRHFGRLEETSQQTALS